MSVIGVLDSGIGGTTILNELRKELPICDFVYYADNKNNPYGDKTNEEIFRLVDNIVKYLITNYNTKIIVIACNTATTCCINKLRVKYKDIYFIGTVPAIKVACDNNYKNILVLATNSTINSSYIKNLVNDNIKDKQNIYLVPCPGLADAIENNNENKIDEILKNIYIKYSNVDCIVLGCTHYPLIKDKIRKYFKESILIDSSMGVTKETKRIINNYQIDTLGSDNITYIYSSHL